MRRALFALLCLSACSYTDPATVGQVAALSPLQADPAVLAVALQLPKELVVPKDGATLAVDVTRADTGATRALTFALQAQSGAVAGVPETAGEILTVYRLTPTDVARLRDLQAEVAGWKAESPPADTSGHLGLGLAACTRAGRLDPRARGAAWVRLQADGPFLPLIPDSALRDVLGAALFDAIAPCDGPA
jgi:hypothetical protein